MTVADLKKGESAIISEIEDDEESLKLLEMGCLPGERITLQMIAPFGDPIAVEIGDYYILSMRRSEAARVKVKKEDA